MRVPGSQAGGFCWPSFRVVMSASRVPFVRFRTSPGMHQATAKCYHGSVGECGEPQRQPETGNVMATGHGVAAYAKGFRKPGAVEFAGAGTDRMTTSKKIVWTVCLRTGSGGRGCRVARLPLAAGATP